MLKHIKTIGTIYLIIFIPLLGFSILSVFHFIYTKDIPFIFLSIFNIIITSLNIHHGIEMRKS